MASSQPRKQLRKSNPYTIHGKFLVAYHGWYTCPGDGQPLYQGHHGWHKWFERPLTDKGRPRFDLYPDVSGYPPSQLYAVPGLTLPDNQAARLFSSRNPETTKRHFHMMAQHGIDGSFLVRMANECEVDGDSWSPLANLMRVGDEVLDGVRAATEAEGRVWAIMYDVSGVAAGRMSHVLHVDWAHLVVHKRILDSPSYLREGGKPVIGIKGIGLKGAQQQPEIVLEIINQLRTFTPGGAYVLAGVPTSWRTPGEGDNDYNPAFLDVYRQMDAISPWSVGRYKDLESADWHAVEMKEDIKTIRQWNAASEGRKVHYVPVAFPGLSRANMSTAAAFNEIPRQRGTFLWRQVYHMQHEGAHTIIGASFDDFNSSTALMPAVPLSRLLPKEGRFLALDADGDASLPPDWYLRICGMVGEAMRGEKRIATDLMPKKELDDYWAMRPKYEEDVYAEAGGSGASLFDPPPNPPDTEAGIPPANVGSPAGASDPRPAPGPPVRSGTVDFDNLAPAPPPYSLEAEASEANLQQASPAASVSNTQTQSTAEAALIAPARQNAASSTSSRPTSQPFTNITPSGLQNPVIHARPLPTNSTPRPVPSAQPAIPVSNASTATLQSSRPQSITSSPGPAQVQPLPPADSRPRPTESRPWSPFRRTQSPNSRPSPANQPTLPMNSRPNNQSPSPGRMSSPLATPPQFSNALYTQAGPSGSGQASPQIANVQAQSNQQTSGSTDEATVGGFAAPSLIRQQSNRLGDLPPPPFHPSLNPNVNTPSSGINSMNSGPDSARPGAFTSSSSTQPVFGQPEPSRPPVGNYPSMSSVPDPGYYPSNNGRPPRLIPSGFSQPHPGYPQPNMGPPGFAPQVFPNTGPSTYGPSTYGPSTYGPSTYGPSTYGPSAYSNPSTPGFAPPGSFPNFGNQRPNSTPPTMQGGPSSFQQPNAPYMPQPPRQDGAVSTSSTGYSSMPVAYPQGPQSRPFNAMPIPSSVMQPVRNVLDRYAGEDTRRRVEGQLDSVVKTGSKWINNFRM